MTITTEELETLLARSESTKDHVRYAARDKLDAMAPELARRAIIAEHLAEAMRRILDRADRGERAHVSVGLHVHARAALTAYDQACKSEGE